MRAAEVRVLGTAVLAGAGLAAWALAHRTDPFNGSTGTIYPWRAWALVAVAGVCGVVALVVPRPPSARRPGLRPRRPHPRDADRRAPGPLSDRGGTKGAPPPRRTSR